jgi:hypothetical protein
MSTDRTEEREAEGVLSAAAVRQLRATTRNLPANAPVGATMLVGASSSAVLPGRGAAAAVGPLPEPVGPAPASATADRGDDTAAFLPADTLPQDAAAGWSGAVAAAVGAPAGSGGAPDPGAEGAVAPIAVAPSAASGSAAAPDAMPPPERPGSAAALPGPPMEDAPATMPEAEEEAAEPPPPVPQVEAAAAIAGAGSGAEDAWIAIVAAFATPDLDGSERLLDTVRIEGVPPGARLSHGVELAPGRWEVATADLLEGRVAILPPPDSDATLRLTLRATVADVDAGGRDLREIVGAAEIRVAAVADAPDVAVRDAAGEEDRAIALDLSAALADADGSEALSLRLLGVPEGARLSAGRREDDGSWRLEQGDLIGLALTPPPDFAGEIALTLRVGATEAANGDTATVERSFRVAVAEVVDGGSIAAAAAGQEDRPIPLAAVFAPLRDASERWDDAVLVRGVPPGASLEGGTPLGDGTWRVLRAALEAGSVALRPPAQCDATIALTLEAQVVEAGGARAPVTAPLTVAVAAVADAPIVAAGDVAGAEDAPIALDLSAALADADGSETMAVRLIGLPDGAGLSAGTRDADGSWHLPAGALATLLLTPPAHFAGTLALTLQVTATEGANGDAATREVPFRVAVAPRAEADARLVAGGSGAEESWIPIAASFVTPDADESEQLAEHVTIQGVPPGATLSEGVEVAAGRWSVPRDALLSGRVALRPPADSDADIRLTLAATLRDTADGGADDRPLVATAEIRVAAVADAPLVAVRDASGAEDRSIPLDLSAALADRDGSEALSLALLGVPDGASLSAGQRDADGAWLLEARDLAGLALLPPPDFAGTLRLTLRATATEAADGDAATVERAFSVRVAAVVDGARLDAAAAGAEDTAIPIRAAFGASADATEQWAPTVQVGGVPPGARLTAGEELGDGIWRVDRAALEAGAVAIVPPQDSDAPVALTLSAQLLDTEGEGAARTIVTGFTAAVAAVADAPRATAQDVTGAEDTAIPLALTAALADRDGSEALRVAILGLPAGAALSAGTRQPDGSWVLSPADLPGLTLTPPRDFAGVLALALSATATEAANADAATVALPFSVTVAARADAVAIAAKGDGQEDRWIAIRGTLSMTDADGSEQLAPTLTIHGVPAGATLSHGTSQGGGTWSVPRGAFEAGELAILPPANTDADIVLRIAATTLDGEDSRITDAAATIVVRAVADAPSVRVADARGNEDTPIRLAGLGGALADTDGSERLGFLIAGLPQGARLTAGSRNTDGTWSLTPAQLDTVSVVPPAHFSGSMTLSLTAIAREQRDGAPAARTTASFTVAVGPVADAGSIGGLAAGDEDTWIALRPAFATPDGDGSERWSDVTVVSGVPAGAALNLGIERAPGLWEVPTQALRGGLVAIRPPADSDADVKLGLQAVLSDAGNGTVSTRTVTGSLTVTVRATADAPVVQVRDASGAEDTPIRLDLAAALADADGSESLALVLLGLPEGASLSAGARNADGSWSLSAADLPGLTLAPPRDASGSIALTLRATAREARDGGSAVVEHGITVQVAGVADAPTLRTGPTMGVEDGAIALRISATTTDLDGSERIVAFRIRDLPDGAVLRAAGAELARQGDGSVLVDAAAAPSLSVTPPPHGDADFTLRVAAISEEPNGSRAESSARDLPVRVEAVADAPVWLRLGADGAEDAPIPLGLAARLVDTDGSEQLSYVISGVPDGATLSAGRWHGPGRWSLTAEEAADVTLTPPRDFSGTFTLTATAVAQEIDGGAQAVSTVRFPVRVAAVIDTGTWSATTRGAEDTRIALDLAPPLRDRDGSERLVGEVVVEGVPDGAVLRLADGSAVAVAGGVARLAASALPGLGIVMPADSDRAAVLGVTVTVEDDGGLRQQVRGAVTVDPSGVADTPGLKVESVTLAGPASQDPSDGWAPLPIAAALRDTDGSETLHVWLRGVPSGFALSAGTPAGEGAWLLREADLPGLRVRPPAGFEGDVALAVRAVAVEREGDEARRAAELTLHVVAPRSGDDGEDEDKNKDKDKNDDKEKDKDKDKDKDDRKDEGDRGDDCADGGGKPAVPALSVAPADGREDEALPLAITLGPAPKEARIGVIVEGLPAGSRLSAGIRDPDRDAWVLGPDDLRGLQVIPPRDFAGSIAPRVTALVIGATGATSRASTDARLHLEAVADGPAIAAAPPAAREDTAVPLNLGIAGADADGSETVTAITLSGLSPGAAIAPAAGIRANGDGTWTVEPWAAGSVRLVPPENAHGTFGLTVTATVREASDGSTGTRSRGVSVAVAPAADAPVVAATDAAGTEDRPIPLGLSAALADRDGSEVLSVVVAGLPDGARLSAGINNGDGSWTLAPVQLAGLTVTPPGDWSGSMALTLHAHAMERSTGEVASASVPFRVSVAGAADTPLVDAAAGAAGREDAAIALDIVARLTDADGSEALTLVVAGVPAGARFSAGQGNPDGSWTIPGEAIPGLRFTPPPDFAGTLRLDVAATATERDGDAAARRFTVAVTVDPVADAPLLSLAAVQGAEDSAIPLPLAAAVADADGSESIARFHVAGLPVGATLSAGTRGADGTWTLTPEQAASVSLTPPPNWSGSIALTVTAVSREAANGDEASRSATLPVTVTPVADAPLLSVSPAAGAEDAVIRLPIAAALADTDGSERIVGFEVAGLPSGMTLSAGTRAADGTWALTPEQAAGVTLMPPRDWSGRFDLTVTAISREEAGGAEARRTATLPVTVAAVADAPVLDASDALGMEDASVALDLSVVLADTYGSETLGAITLSGLPSGFTLSAGQQLGGGTWRLVAEDLPGLRLTPPADWNGTLALTLTATARDGASASTATRGFAVTLAPLADAPVLSLAAAPAAATGQESASVLADAAIADVDSARMGGASITLSGAAPGDRLGFHGIALREQDGQWMLDESGIALRQAPDGSVVLSGAASAGTYARVLDALVVENPAGLASGTRSIAVTLHDEGGTAAATRSVALDVAPSVVTGGATDTVLAGTAGHDTFTGGAGRETMLGGAGADLFLVSAGGGADRIEGGEGSWLDTVKVGGAGAPGEGGWTLVLDNDAGATRTDQGFDFAQPVSGSIHFADGTQVELAQIERITW